MAKGRSGLPNSPPPPPQVADQVGQVVLVFGGEVRVDLVVETLVPANADDLVALSAPVGEFGAEVVECLARLVDDGLIVEPDFAATVGHGTGRAELGGECLAAPGGLDDQHVIGAIEVAQNLTKGILGSYHGAVLAEADRQVALADVGGAEGVIPRGIGEPPDPDITAGGPGEVGEFAGGERRVGEEITEAHIMAGHPVGDGDLGADAGGSQRTRRVGDGYLVGTLVVDVLLYPEWILSSARSRESLFCTTSVSVNGCPNWTTAFPFVSTGSTSRSVVAVIEIE